MKATLHTLLANASLTHRKKCRQQFQELNLSEGQPKVLSNLLAKEGIVQKELASICCVEPATMTSLLKKMEADQLIEKRSTSVSGGKRAYCIYLTKKGRDLAEAADHIMDKTEELAFSNFTEEEKQTFLELIVKLTDNLT